MRIIFIECCNLDYNMIICKYQGLVLLTISIKEYKRSEASSELELSLANYAPYVEPPAVPWQQFLYHTAFLLSV